MRPTWPLLVLLLVAAGARAQDPAPAEDYRLQKKDRHPVAAPARPPAAAPVEDLREVSPVPWLVAGGSLLAALAAIAWALGERRLRKDTTDELSRMKAYLRTRGAARLPDDERKP